MLTATVTAKPKKMTAKEKAALLENFDSVLAQYNKENNVVSPFGITGDPSCPYRDWRGTPMEIGSHIAYLHGSYGKAPSVREGEVVDFKITPTKSKAPWNFTVGVIVKRGKGPGFRKDGSPIAQAKTERVISVDKVTVVY